ncbi:group III truncated hemoglobin [Devosia sp. XJ19-1]|uniref:Group III truncated hemoglobin n=1 Tax=Devosia ureilytica TaxID=2952754 RepID=A0A9Q4AQD8_9HYPH|nr:group III truncated hemoglobin [Devosia ureilytica]MCP8884169.1 group III truncated hemoglobin [Devosia ureilytica]MCP8887777.1 group III truncated hemoglobin [Devosia ureilytica]
MHPPDRPPVGTQLHRIGWETPEGLDEAMIRAVVDEFYARARRDDVIGPVFNRVIPDPEWPAHLDKITDFWSSMLLGTGRYSGRPMPKHMGIPELADAHFIRWLRLFRETVEETCPPDVAALFIERSERIGNSFRMNISMRRGEDITRLSPLPREESPSWKPPA